MTEMSRIQKVPALAIGRAETGTMQFDGDWPGVFIRGDNALWNAQAIGAALKFLPAGQWLIRAQLEGLMKTLQACHVNTHE